MLGLKLIHVSKSGNGWCLSIIGVNSWSVAPVEHLAKLCHFFKKGCQMYVDLLKCGNQEWKKSPTDITQLRFNYWLRNGTASYLWNWYLYNRCNVNSAVFINNIIYIGLYLQVKGNASVETCPTPHCRISTASGTFQAFSEYNTQHTVDTFNDTRAFGILPALSSPWLRHVYTEDELQHPTKSLSIKHDGISHPPRAQATMWCYILYIYLFLI